MQSEELDKKFREAAQNHHPAYDEKAWSRMEKLLDKHLPNEERRRRWLLLFLLFAGLGTAGMLIWKPFGNNIKTVSGTMSIKSGDQQSPLPLNQKPAADDVERPIPETNLTPIIVDERVTPKYPVTNPMGKSGTVMLNRQKKRIPDLTQSPATLFTTPEKNIFKPVNNSKESEAPLKQDEVESVSLIQSINSTVKSTVKERSNPTEIDKSSNGPLAQAEASKQSKKKKTHSFFFSFSAGPDLSYIRLNKPGTVKLFGGGGVGYTYNNKLTLRTGFYSGRKIYSAKAEDYDAPASFYAYYPYLQDVDANCKVYEVPVLVSYNFSRAGKPQLFATAGVSSYFMKKETYNYHYKYSPTGPTVTKERTLSDVNKHHLAGLTISAGYSRNITRHLSIMAEPYAKIPLKGVGFGNVKLNSMGVQFSLGIQPFAKKRAIK